MKRMSDYSFMRSGLLSVENEVDADIMHKLVALVKTLMEDALQSAEKFVIACGRTAIQDKDIAMALKYETHEFLNQGETLETKFFTNLQEEKQHTYDTESESENDYYTGDDDTDEDTQEENKEEYSIILKPDNLTPELIEIHRKFIKYHNEWDDWHPTDPVSIFMKSSVDKTSAQCGVF